MDRRCLVHCFHHRPSKSKAEAISTKGLIMLAIAFIAIHYPYVALPSTIQCLFIVLSIASIALLQYTMRMHCRALGGQGEDTGFSLDYRNNVVKQQE